MWYSCEYMIEIEVSGLEERVGGMIYLVEEGPMWYLVFCM